MIPAHDPCIHGRVDYSGDHRFDPDRDTVHLLDPVLSHRRNPHPVAGRPIRGVGRWNLKRRAIEVEGIAQKRPYVAVRFEAIDAPEQHYLATPFSPVTNGQKTKITYARGWSIRSARSRDGNPRRRTS